jgi:hypothetical protein
MLFLQVTFDKRTKIAATDTLGFYLDEACSQLVRTVSGEDVATYHPFEIPASMVYVKFLGKESSRAPLWGWRAYLSPKVRNLTC